MKLSRKRLRAFLLVSSVVLLTGCTSVNIEEYADTAPPFRHCGVLYGPNSRLGNGARLLR